MTTSEDRRLGTAREVTAGEVAFFRQHGWAKLDGFVPPGVVRGLREEIQGLMGAGAERYRGADRPTRPGGDPFATMWRTYDEPSRDNDFLREFATSAAVGRAGSRFLRDRPVRFYRDEVLVKMPAATRTPWHQDFPYSSRDRSEQVNLWIALNDLTPEHSTLRFLSGSHRQGVLGRALATPDDDLVAQYPELLDECTLSPPLHLRAGDATVHHSLVVHTAPPNTAAEPRWAYTVVLFQAGSLYTGAPGRLTDQLGLKANEPLDHPLMPVTWTP
ncbi:phytanoyl-CoA dioxygenase family protein [Lentzea sp.]|uniref:phytanoyl-CoA dioxygenase family protein n=1 Tax=Lentzea sp. TaxID=56099 RepID=UPI002B6D3ECB|nr:phytanoyl-CoA dioxygenase family protein [Lentzea sp.]HUQ56470.1 phytanoyl-CoA dioxygenase family protein [Lentzea sp.]